MASGFSFWRGLAPCFLSALRIMSGLLILEFGTMKNLHFPYSEYFAKIPLLTQLWEAPADYWAGVQPMMLIWIAGLLELVGGALLVVGLLTRFTAFILSGEMAFAYFMAHAPHGFYPALNEGLAAVLFCFIFLYLSAAGAGPLSLDRLIRKGG